MYLLFVLAVLVLGWLLCLTSLHHSRRIFLILRYLHRSLSSGLHLSPSREESPSLMDQGLAVCLLTSVYRTAVEDHTSKIYRNPEIDSFIIDRSRR